MSASAANRRACPEGFAAARLAKANGFMEAAELTMTFDEAIELRDAYVTLWIHSGIASADYICCKRLGEYHSSDDPFFLDPSLGRQVFPRVVRVHGLSVHVHDDVNAYPTIAKFIAKHQAPCIARLSRPGREVVLDAGSHGETRMYKSRDERRAHFGGW